MTDELHMVTFRPTLRHRLRRLLRRDRRVWVNQAGIHVTPTNPPYTGGWCLAHGWFRGRRCPGDHA